jgi:hypothetical protein
VDIFVGNRYVLERTARVQAIAVGLLNISSPNRCRRRSGERLDGKPLILPRRLSTASFERKLMNTDSRQGPQFSRSRTSGAVVYEDYRDNFAIWPGSEPALQKFVNQMYGDQPHKLRHTKSSNSEDALTWSCFDALRQVDETSRASALANLWTLAFEGVTAPAGLTGGKIIVGEKYGKKGDETEVDASIEGEGVLVFIEAKLYSSMSLKDKSKGKEYDQIAKKLRVGLKESQRTGKEFYFIILDIAPKEALRTLNPRPSLKDAESAARGGFPSKWNTAFWFSRYKGIDGDVSPLREVLEGIPGVDAKVVARNMGWLTWPDVYKAVLRAVIASCCPRAISR